MVLFFTSYFLFKGFWRLNEIGFFWLLIKFLGFFLIKLFSKNIIYFLDFFGGLKSFFRIILSCFLFLDFFFMYWKIKGRGGEKR